jgi:hypothetical protein
VTDDAPIPLSSVIRALRRELVEAVREGKGSGRRFALDPIELELHVEVASTGGGEGESSSGLVSRPARISAALALTRYLHARPDGVPLREIDP